MLLFTMIIQFGSNKARHGTFEREKSKETYIIAHPSEKVVIETH